MSKVIFEYRPEPVIIEVTREKLRETLEEVRDQLLSHGINGGGRKLDMDLICDQDGCGTAACIGGWASIFIIGVEAKSQHEQNYIAALFQKLFETFGTRLSRLFHGFDRTKNYNEPNVAATAIQRYLDGKEPWPHGEMPNVLRYKRVRAPVKKAAKKRSR